MILGRHNDVDAVVCDSDRIARGVLDVLKSRGVRVPEDIAITGFDNWQILAEGPSPEITSVDMNLDNLGRQAARALFEAMSGKGLPSGVHLEPCSLVIRGSTIPDA